jgi:hypothetical protein
MQRSWKVLQLIALIPVAAMSAVGASLAFAGLGNVFSTWNFADFGAALVFALGFISPLFMVFCLYFAIMQEPQALRARPRLAAAVLLGLGLGSLLTLVLIWMLVSGDDTPGPSLLVFVLPLALAILHMVRIARAVPATAAEPPIKARPLE